MTRTASVPRPAGPCDYAMLLGIKVLDWPQLILGVERGLPYRAIEVSRTEVGAREVENIIGRVRHGVYS